MAPPPDVNDILRNLRGEHFRRARNVQGESASTNSLASHAPTLPLGLIYPIQHPESGPAWIPGPSPPRSWQSPPSTEHVAANTPAWRAHALSLLFSASPSRPLYPDPSRVPPLTILCLQLIRTVCPDPLAPLVPFIPPHLRLVLARYAALHAPLSQTELDAFSGDTELLVIGPAVLRPRTLATDSATETWDTVREEPPVLRTLAVVSSPLSAAVLRAFPPTVTHLALIDVPHRVPLARLPSLCPLVVVLDVSFNAWLRSTELEEVEWNRLRRLEVLGVRGCLVTDKLLLELNRGRWEEVTVIR